MSNEQYVTNNIKVQNNDMEVLRKNFPQCFDKDGNFDIEKFTNQLKTQNSALKTDIESYSLEWLGKSYARLLANEPTTTLLKEDKAHNQKEENRNAENLLIKGDNLEVLKHLLNCYYEQIKMIYIDPPYNTGSDDFVYQDDRKYTIKQLQELIGIDEEKAKRIYNFTNNKSNSHSAWLTFMYPRLYLAQKLLKDDGVIFVSIDDNEVAQLRLLMDEIFGEENFVSELPTVMNLKGNNDQYAFSGTHEYTLVYSKDKDQSLFNEFKIEEDNLEWTEDEKGLYKKGSGLLATSEGKFREDRPYLYFPILIKDDKVFLIDETDYKKIYLEDENTFDDDFINQLIIKYEAEGFNVLLPIDKNKNKLRWTWGYEGKFKTDVDDIIVTETKNGYSLYKKQRPSLGELPSKKPKTIFYKPSYSSGNGTAQIQSLLGDKIFKNPKPIELIKDFITIGLNSNDFCLDFFAGSGTTGDAVMQLNAEDGGNRKYILVQLPEPLDPKKNRTAFDFVKNELKAEPTIFEITKERLKRAAIKINEEINEKIKSIKNEIQKLEYEIPTDDINDKINSLKEELTQNLKLKTQNYFKIFETMPIWEDYNFEAEKFDTSQTLFDAGKLTEEDIQSLLLTWKTYDNIPLTQELESLVLSSESLVEEENKEFLALSSKSLVENNNTDESNNTIEAENNAIEEKLTTKNSQLKTNNYVAYYGKGKLYLMYKDFKTENLKNLLEKIDNDKNFNPTSIITFGYHIESKSLREISENIRAYSNKKNINLDFIVRF